MDDEKAIEQLEEFLVIDDWSAVYMPELQDAIEYVIDRIKADRCVPVTERLPNRNGVYNVTRKLKEGETIYFISDASYFDGQNTWYHDTGINHGRPYLTDIIAWRPLPESYKDGDDKND